MRLARAVPAALVSLGVFLVGVGVATGSARLYLVVFLPVVAGSSGWLIGGVACLFVGFLTLPLLWSEERPTVPTGPPRPAGAGETVRSGGLILLGPVPIFFGGWRHPSARLYWLAVAVGAALFVGLLVALVFFVV